MAEARASAEWAEISARRSWMSAIRAGSEALSDSLVSALSSRSAAITVSRSDMSEAGASWATPPIFAPLGTLIRPISGSNWPSISLKRVVLPVPLRPTKPTLWPPGMVREHSSKSGFPSMEKPRFEIVNMIGTSRGFAQV